MYRKINVLVQHGIQIILRRPMVMVVSLWLATIMLAVTVIPLLLVNHAPQGNVFSNIDSSETAGNVTGATEEASTVLASEDIPLKVSIYLTREKRIEELPLEQYIRGVVAAEMPIEFELEALKAQAIAARTYIVRRYVEKDFSNVPVAGAWVTDSVQHQAYLTEKQMEEKWSKSPDKLANLKKLNRAVQETKGIIITYNGLPILASYFSTSNGYTENSEDYWTVKLPYLRSVESPGEEILSPKYITSKSYSIAEVIRKLDVAAIPVSTRQATASRVITMKVLERTDGNRIKRIQVGNKVLSGREVREGLDLGSTQFAWRAKGNTIEFTVYGSGHGVGMSQWGAQAMAKDGRKAREIISHYYKGVSIEKIHNLESSL
jgi:stage II sporulation protein D